MDPAYIEILDTNKEQRKELDEEISINKDSEKKSRLLIKEVEACYRLLLHQDSTIIAHKDEIISLKAEISSLKKRLKEIQQDVKLKDEASSVQDNYIIKLENKINQLKARIKELIDKKISVNKLKKALEVSDIMQSNPIVTILSCQQLQLII